MFGTTANNTADIHVDVSRIKISLPFLLQENNQHIYKRILLKSLFMVVKFGNTF